MSKHTDPASELDRLEELLKVSVSGLSARLDRLSATATPDSAPTTPVRVPEDIAEVSSGLQNSERDSIAQDLRTFQALMWQAISCVRRQLNEVNERVDVLETNSRRKVLLFHGVEEREGEQVLSVVSSLLAKMNVTESATGVIKFCHRLGNVSPSGKRQRPILVRFSSMDVRAAVWRKKTALKGTGASVSEFLTVTRHRIFTEARRLFGIPRSWTRDAHIFVVMPNGVRHRVSSIARLRELAAELPIQAPMDGADIRVTDAKSADKNASTALGSISNLPGDTRKLRSKAPLINKRK